MYNFNQPVLTDYNPFVRGGKKRCKRTRRHKRRNSNRRSRRRYH